MLLAGGSANFCEMEDRGVSAFEIVRGSGEPHAVAALAALLHDEAGAEVARAEVASDLRVQALFDALRQWPPTPSAGALDAKDAIWKVTVLADFGLDRSDPRVADLAGRLLVAQGADGTFVHGGFNHTSTYDTRGYVCVTHAITGALARFGYSDEPAVRAAADAMLLAERLDGGWRPSRQLAIGTSRGKGAFMPVRDSERAPRPGRVARRGRA